MSYVAFSFNQPKFSPTASWNYNAIIFANQSIVGSQPYSVFVNTNNTIFVANRENSTILVWHENTNNPNKIIGNFTNPRSLFVTSNGHIFIDDGFKNRQVQRWTPNTKTFDIVMQGNSACFGLFVDTNETLYCSMIEDHQVVKRSLNDSEMTSIFVRVAGTGVQGSEFNQLNQPWGIFVDVNFDLYVADWGNDRVQLFPSGESNGITIAGSRSINPTFNLLRPSGILLDAEKYLFIVDMWNQCIVGSSSNGFRCLVGGYGKGEQSNRLNEPVSLSFDRFGNMLVADRWSQRIQKFEYLGSRLGKSNKSEMS